ncbi:putative inactive receptor kinase [Acorus gramineus]|uniref:Inactive receptor kinase n=1 Tax=Acorus gramineus TaxID=55184 RepID=A0AAV9AH75_ACOGR|nr:putative inactive receptor kinase [Acorus gramineus]
MATPPTLMVLSLHLLIFSIFPSVISDLASDKAALLTFRSAVGRSTLQWNPSDQSPCNWQGLSCESGRVTVLRLPGVGLIGQVPAGVFGNLTKLRTLSLRFNALSGPLPSDLASLSELRNLYLHGNDFSGQIPPSLLRLSNLVRLNLAHNAFSGEIPAGLSNLTRLGTLYFENNQLTGSIPDFNLTNLGQFNVSNNRLNGSVPIKLRKMPSDAFRGNLGLCGAPVLPACPGEAALPPSVVSQSPALAPMGTSGGGGVGEKKKKKKLSGGAIAGIAVGSVVGLFVITALLILLCRKKSSNRTRSLEVPASKPHPAAAELQLEKEMEERGLTSVAEAAVAPPLAAAVTTNRVKKLMFFGGAGRVFDLEDLLRASAEVLGKGTFGTSYKAALEIGLVVAVKRLKDVTISEREFRERIEAVGLIDHENLVPLRAYYFSKDEKLLVYDYMPMGSLSALLHGNRGAGRTPLNWETRTGIALGAARGMEYLHSQGSDVSHGNIKSSNILLTKNNNARVSDFGLATLVGPSTSPNPNRVAGYRAPEVTDTRRISQKADIYSFGVLLLELLTGKAPAQALLNEEGVDLPRWVQSVVKEEWTAEVFDLELLRYQNVEEEMVQLLQLAIDCAAQYPDNRPSMSEVASRIEEIRRSSLHLEQQNGHYGDESPLQIDSIDPLPAFY